MKETNETELKAVVVGEYTMEFTDMTYLLMSEGYTTDESSDEWIWIAPDAKSYRLTERYEDGCSLELI